MHVPKEQRSKLDSKTTPCVFVGYGDEEYGFRIYDPEKKKVVRSRDVVYVVFFEHEKGAELLSTRYSTTTSDFVVDTNDASSVPNSTLLDQIAVEDVETTLDGVKAVHPDDVADVPDFDDHVDDAPEVHDDTMDIVGAPHEEEVHEQGEQPTP